MPPNSPYLADWKRLDYMTGYNDRCNGNEKRKFDDRKRNRAYKRGWDDAGK